MWNKNTLPLINMWTFQTVIALCTRKTETGPNVTIGNLVSAALSCTVARSSLSSREAPRVDELLPDDLRWYGMSTFSLITRKGTPSFTVTVLGKFDPMWRWPLHGRQVLALKCGECKAAD